MRVLVCGGRDYSDRDRVWQVLDEIAPSLVIHGDARGADRLARDWAQERGIPETGDHFRARWEDTDRPGAVIRRRKDGSLYDAAAGHVRNQRMLDEGQPDLVVAFPGGRGTADMLARTKRADVRFKEIDRP